MLGGRNVRKFSAAYSSSRHLQLHALAHCKNILELKKYFLRHTAEIVRQLLQLVVIQLESDQVG